jgi:hypothetical protein
MLDRSFYSDVEGMTYLKRDGFMLDWARRAARLVFRDIEELHADNIVTFAILSLFWYSQGSWRLCNFYKGDDLHLLPGVEMAHSVTGNACTLLYIGGYGFNNLENDQSLAAEIQRRRLWACYMMQCTLGESLALFDAVADVERLPLPWLEEEFSIGACDGPATCLSSSDGRGGVYAELIKVQTYW